MEFPICQFVPIAPCSVAGHSWKEPGTNLLDTHSLDIYKHLLDPSSVQPILNSPRSLNLSSRLKTLIVFVSLCRTLYSSSLSFLN